MEYIGIGTAATAGLVAAGAVGYRVIRPVFPAKVKCHFCGEITQVPFANRNCWDCLNCEQYNGFLPDGGYNKPIPAQHYESMNHPISPEQKTDEKFNRKADVLCAVCTRNQLLKVKQLANYVPYNEANYDMEMDAYKYHLEQIYHLCRMCEHKVKHVLAKQDVELLQQFEESSNAPPPESSFPEWEDSFNCSTHLACRLSTPLHICLLRMTSFLCALSLLITSSCQLLSDSEIAIKPTQHLPPSVISYLKVVYTSSVSLALIGTFTTLLAIYVSGKQRLTATDALDAFVWMAILILHSYFVSMKLSTSDRYLLQSCVGTINTVLTLWCLAVPRFEKKSKLRIRKKKRRYEFDSSALSSATGSPAVSERSSPLVSPVTSATSVHSTSSEHSSPEQDPFGRFETMSLGKRRPGKSRSVYELFGGSERVPDPPISSSQSERGNLESLRTRGPLIKPARLNPSSQGSVFSGFSKAPSEPIPSTSQSVTSSRSVHEDHERALRGGSGRSEGGSIWGDVDRASQFSTFRSTVAEEESDNSSSPCPVDTTSCNQGSEISSKRSLLVQCLLGVSIGVNLFLFVYFCTDFENISKRVIETFVKSDMDEVT